jgi:2-oxoisovalerate dehydrogenase E1 component beta subunit
MNTQLSTMPVAHALNAGLRDAMEADNKVMLIGGDIGQVGGVFRVTDILQKSFGDPRGVDSPLGEAGIVGSASRLDEEWLPGLDRILDAVDRSFNY